MEKIIDARKWKHLTERQRYLLMLQYKMWHAIQYFILLTLANPISLMDIIDIIRENYNKVPEEYYPLTRAEVIELYLIVEPSIYRIIEYNMEQAAKHGCIPKTCAHQTRRRYQHQHHQHGGGSGPLSLLTEKKDQPITGTDLENFLNELERFISNASYLYPSDTLSGFQFLFYLTRGSFENAIYYSFPYLGTILNPSSLFGYNIMYLKDLWEQRKELDAQVSAIKAQQQQQDTAPQQQASQQQSQPTPAEQEQQYLQRQQQQQRHKKYEQDYIATLKTISQQDSIPLEALLKYKLSMANEQQQISPSAMLWTQLYGRDDVSSLVAQQLLGGVGATAYNPNNPNNPYNPYNPYQMISPQMQMQQYMMGISQQPETITQQPRGLKRLAAWFQTKRKPNKKKERNELIEKNKELQAKLNAQTAAVQRLMAVR